MNRLLFTAICVYAPHLLEEHVTHMADDPLIVFALSTLENVPARHASYAVFQIMMMLALTMTLLFSLGGAPRKIVMGLLAFSLLAESHHLVRFLISPHYNSGLLTALPMPVVGILIFQKLFAKEKHQCSTTSSSPWASGESRSA
ncbi:MAG: hypothetical protein ABI183_15220 [Polyangiaceae bacterium]